MHQPLVHLEVKLLEKMYLQEVEILKLQLLSGAFGKKLEKQRNKALQLAHIIHEKRFGIPPFELQTV